MTMKFKISVLLLLGLPLSSYSFAEDPYKKLANLSIIDKSKFQSEDDIRSELRDLLEAKQFKKLDRMIQDALQQRKLYQSGKLYHTVYLDALMGVSKGDRVKALNHYEKNLTLAQDWVSASPKSAVAYVNYALAQRAQAWAVRGGQYSSDVPEKQMEYFAKEIVNSINFLVENYEVASKEPFYYVVLGYSLRELGLLEQSVEVYYDGIGKYPDYRPIYNEFLGQFKDKWSGYNEEAVAQIIADIQEANPKHQDLYYYHILFTANNNGYRPTRFNVDWDRVEKGAVETLALLPTMDRIGQVYELYCSTPGNKQRMLKLNKAFKSGEIKDPQYVNFINNCPD